MYVRKIPKSADRFYFETYPVVDRRILEISRMIEKPVRFIFFVLGNLIQQSPQFETAVLGIDFSSYFRNLRGIVTVRVRRQDLRIGKRQIRDRRRRSDEGCPVIVLLYKPGKRTPGIFYADSEKRRKPHEADLAVAFPAILTEQLFNLMDQCGAPAICAQKIYGRRKKT